MKIAMAQMVIPWKSYDKNKETCRGYFEKAKEDRAELLIFPEMTLTGFDVKSPDLAQKEQETVDFFEQLTKEYRLCAVYGYAGGGREKFRNHLRMTDCGRTLMEYEKIHPFSFGAEGEYFEGGDKVVSGYYKEGFFSGMICYDLRFPEIFQEASKTCGCLIVIANWPEARAMAWTALLQARAIENLSYVVGVNCTGQCGPLLYKGMSAVYGPDGTLVGGGRVEEGLFTADLDFGWVKEFRGKFPFKKDRRPDVYNQFYSNEYKREN